MTSTPVVLFACVHNAGRSQMAAALFNMRVRPGAAHAISAGTQPATHVHPEVVQVLRDIGIDVQSARPVLLTEALAQSAMLLVTMGCGEACPLVPGLAREDWPLDDPKGRPLDEVRRILGEIDRRIDDLLRRNGWR